MKGIVAGLEDIGLADFGREPIPGLRCIGDENGFDAKVEIPSAAIDNRAGAGAAVRPRPMPA